MTHVVRTHFIALKDLIEETDRLVGARRRSRFISEAIAEKLQREKLLRLTREARKLPAERVSGWETPDAVSQWVRDLRTDNDLLRNV